jgi:hypothetical protein
VAHNGRLRERGTGRREEEERRSEVEGRRGKGREGRGVCFKGINDFTRCLFFTASIYP